MRAAGCVSLYGAMYLGKWGEGEEVIYVLMQEVLQ